MQKWGAVAGAPGRGAACLAAPHPSMGCHAAKPLTPAMPFEPARGTHLAAPWRCCQYAVDRRGTTFSSGSGADCCSRRDPAACSCSQQSTTTATQGAVEGKVRILGGAEPRRSHVNERLVAVSTSCWRSTLGDKLAGFGCLPSKLHLDGPRWWARAGVLYYRYIHV